MSMEEFEQLPFSFAYKQEYSKGCLIETRREVVVHGVIPVAPRSVNSAVLLRPMLPSDELDLLPSFKGAFRTAFEFAEYGRKKFADSARQCLHHFFRGPFHLPLPASRVAVARSGSRNAGKPIGAALVLAQDDGWALLDMLFVAPVWQRQGIATALAATALTALHEIGGYKTLVSRYHLGNEQSCNWHHKFGFVDQPDLLLANLRWRAALRELHRLEKSGNSTPERKLQLVQERDHWKAQGERLHELAREGRFEEADPWQKWRRKPRKDDVIRILNPAFPAGSA
jgi:GNAT superfamily N-acetyltransferase